MEAWNSFVDWFWTPTVSELIQISFFGWIISLAVAFSLKQILRRVKLNVRVEEHLPKAADGEATIDLEDWIVDAVYWSGVACTAVIALYGLFT